MSEEDPLFDLFCYMSSSAKGLLDEPKSYGPLRLVESMERLIEIIEKNEFFQEKEVYSEIKEKIKEEKHTVMTDEERFEKFLDDLVQLLAEEA